MKEFDIPPLVSICCITYNHVKYIAEAIQSFLMQIADFEYEIIIGEDHSTDGTKEVIEQYIAEYPDRITLVSHNPNIGSIKNQTDTIGRARGQYIALCDGDDFWTDPHKLQKQVDFLEANPDYVMCCHHTRVIDEYGKTMYLKDTPQEMEFSYTDVLLGKREETRNSSIMVRNQNYIHDIGKLDWYYRTFATDMIFKLYVLAESQQKIFVLPDVMACYRNHQGGMWSMINDGVRRERVISDFNIMVNHFSYTPLAKRSLLKIYMNEHLLFDLRKLKIVNAFNTLTNLI